MVLVNNCVFSKTTCKLLNIFHLCFTRNKGFDHADALVLEMRKQRNNLFPHVSSHNIPRFRKAIQELSELTKKKSVSLSIVVKLKIILISSLFSDTNHTEKFLSVLSPIRLQKKLNELLNLCPLVMTAMNDAI